MSPASPAQDARALVRATGQAGVHVPFLLLRELGAEAAIMLCQGVYFSSLMEKTDGWFFLDQIGDPELGDDEKGNIFQRVGSWKALGCGGPDRQKKIRDRLVSLDLLAERRATMPARIWYRFDLDNYLIFLSSLAKNQDSGNPETELVKSRNLIPEIPILDSGNPGHKKINKEINKKLNTHPAHRAGTHPALPDGEGNVPEIPADAHKQAGQILDQWTPGRRKDGWRILHAIRRQDGSALTPADWYQMLDGLRQAKDQPAWLQKVAATGWDPRRIQDVARPGESAGDAKRRLGDERKPIESQTDQDLQDRIVADILSRRRALPKPMEAGWAAVCAEQLAHLARLNPDHRLIDEAKEAHQSFVHSLGHAPVESFGDNAL